jgi:hypothetical protein
MKRMERKKGVKDGIVKRYSGRGRGRRRVGCKVRMRREGRVRSFADF